MSTKEQMIEVDRMIHAFKYCVKGITITLPYKDIPTRIIVESDNFVMMCLNPSPPANYGVSNTAIPHTIFPMLDESN